MAGTLNLKIIIKMYRMDLLNTVFLNVVQDCLRVIKTKGSESVSDKIKGVKKHMIICSPL